MTVMQRLLPVLFLVLMIALPSVQAVEDDVFPIREESILDEDGQFPTEYLRYGAASIVAGPCGTTATSKVTYPTLKSESPLYGQVTFLQSLANVSGARSYCFVLDRTGTDAGKYDVLYFDANGDRDLTNDGKVGVSQKPPHGLAASTGLGGAATVFDCVELKSPQGDSRSVRWLPWLSMQGARQTYLLFMSTVVRKGTIRIGQQSYEVLLGNKLQGRGASVLLRSEGPTSPSPWKRIALESLQQEEGEFFTMSVDANGEQLTVSPYRGEYGELRIETGDRTVNKSGLAGRLYKSDRSTINLGDSYATELPSQYRFPAGDYRAYLLVDCGDVRASLSSNGYDMQIRDAKPFVLQFADKPAVTFTTPKQDQVFHPGDTIRLKAMLKDRVTGMLVRGLYDTATTTQQRTVRNVDGTSRSIPVYAPLIPTVTVTDASGNQIASGKMPFG